MIFAEEQYTLDAKKITLRSARSDEAQMILDYLKTVTGETRFLMSEPDEIRFTLKDEEKFINDHNQSEDKLFMIAFVDGEYAGSCSFEGEAGSRRARHRVGIGIGLYQKYTGFGLGRLMLQRLLAEAKKLGFEQAELNVKDNNERARHLYESMGFKVYGTFPNANKYDDGTYADDIFMVLKL